MKTERKRDINFINNDSSSEKYLYQFEKPPLQNSWQKFKDNCSEKLGRISLSSLRNAWLVYSLQDFNPIFANAFKPGEIVTEFQTPVGIQYIVRDHELLKFILNKYRNEEEGYFCVPENVRFLASIIKDLYPKEWAAVPNYEQDIINKIIFTAESSHIHSLRSYIMDILKPKAVSEWRDTIRQIASDIVDRLIKDEKYICDPALLVFEFAITVIARIFTGYQASRQDYQRIVHALMVIGKRIGDNIIQKKITKTEKEQYQIALQTMRDVIETNINNTSVPPIIAKLRQNGFSEFAIKMYLFFFYLAGTETTSAATHYLILQLGKKENQHYQQVIRKEGNDSTLLKKCVIEALRLNPPVFIIGRALRKDVLLTKRDFANQLLWSKVLKKGSYIINWVAGAGKDALLYPNPEKFDPYRFESIPTQLSWFPFTSGHHMCPGQFLAKAEMEIFIEEVVRRFNFKTCPEDIEIETKGTFTQHADPNGKLKIKFYSITKAIS